MTLEVAPTPTPVTTAVLLDEHGRTPRGLWRITTRNGPITFGTMWCRMIRVWP